MVEVRRYSRKDDFGVEVDVRVLEVVPKVDDVSLVDGVFDGAFSGEGEEDVVMGEERFGGGRLDVIHGRRYWKKLKMIRRHRKDALK
ncbi:hypothetical protein Tco_1379629 [Tanacetum coccineum]